MKFDFNIHYGKRKIDLSKGGTWNKPLIICIIAIMIFLGFAITSKQWLPDDRIKNTSYTNETLFYNRVNVDTCKTVYVDTSKRLGQAVFEEERTIGEEKNYPLVYKVYDDAGNELSHFVATSAMKVTEKERGLGKRKILIQFAVPKDVYYIDIIVEQKDNTVNHVYIDYRDFKNQELFEKGSKYFDFVEQEEKTLADLQTDLKKEEGKKKQDKDVINKKKDMIQKQKEKVKAIKKGVYD
ncbi:hypothetical protein MKC79_09785 [[Clostridium] innocuum]|nr:hypothetical protein [[Clostridium] innocuum]